MDTGGELTERWSLRPKTLPKLLPAVYFILIAIGALVGFRTAAPGGAMYVVLPAIYLTGLAVSLQQPNDTHAFAFLAITTAFALLLFIDPVEHGLYGVDSYYTLFETDALLAGLDVWELPAQYGDRPVIFYLAALLARSLGVGGELAGKYIPLTSVLLPIFVALAFRRLASTNAGMLAGYGTAGFRTFLEMEAKFVPESIALVLFFTTFYFMSLIHSQPARTSRNQRYRKVVLLILVVTVLLAHSATALAFALLLGWVFLAEAGGRWFPGAISSRTLAPPGTVFLFGVLFAYTFIDWNSTHLAALLAAILGVAEPSSAPPPVGGLSFLDLVNIYGNLGLLAIFAAINALLLLPNVRTPVYALGLLAYNATISILFVVQSIAGALTDLDPVRFLLFVVPTLIGNAGIALIGLQSGEKRQKQAVAAFLVAVFITVQLLGLSTVNLQSDPGDESLEESHYSAQIHAASAWTSNHGVERIYGYERDPWRFLANSDTYEIRREFVPLSEPPSECPDGAVIERNGLLVGGEKNQVYTSGDITVVCL